MGPKCLDQEPCWRQEPESPIVCPTLDLGFIAAVALCRVPGFAKGLAGVAGLFWPPGQANR